ncbi:MAG: hypothetical protein QOH08_1044 [Chloroflexota bacterium]|jgi:uncharacterized protein YkwD|nr:hypothetical protein [Chloroflexota bacterium]
MSRHLRPIVLLLTAALIAGCGDAASPAPDSQQRVKPHTSGGGTVNVGVTGGGIGDAATGGPGGTKLLPSTRVHGQSNTQQGVGAGATCENTDLAPAADNLDAVVTATLCLLNGERADQGLPPLKENAELASAAAAHSQEMVAQQYFDHVGKDGTDPVDRIRAAGYIPNIGVWTVGENLAWGTGALATPKEIVSAWMHSQGHRENILRPQFKEIGFGVVVGNPRSTDGAGATYTTTFGGITAAGAARTATRRTHKGHRRAHASRKRRARIARHRARARISKGSTK